MPAYDFRCTDCRQEYEFPTNDVDFTCCGKQVRRLYRLGGVQFKGSGFYKNDSKKK